MDSPVYGPTKSRHASFPVQTSEKTIAVNLSSARQQNCFWQTLVCLWQIPLLLVKDTLRKQYLRGLSAVIHFFSITSLSCFYFLLRRHSWWEAVPRESVCTNRDLSDGTSCAICFHKLSCANFTHWAAAHEDETPPYERVGGWRAEALYFSTGQLNKWRGPLEVSKRPCLIKGNLFFLHPSSCSLGFLSGPLKGGLGGPKEVPEWECYCFRRCRWHAS